MSDKESVTIKDEQGAIFKGTITNQDGEDVFSGSVEFSTWGPKDRNAGSVFGAKLGAAGTPVFGKVVFGDGASYEGTLKWETSYDSMGRQYSSEGKLLYPNGDVFTGRFKYFVPEEGGMQYAPRVFKRGVVCRS